MSVTRRRTELWCSRPGKPDSVFCTHLSDAHSLITLNSVEFIENASNTVKFDGCGGEDCPPTSFTCVNLVESTWRFSWRYPNRLCDSSCPSHLVGVSPLQETPCVLPSGLSSLGEPSASTSERLLKYYTANWHYFSRYREKLANGPRLGNSS